METLECLKAESKQIHTDPFFSGKFNFFVRPFAYNLVAFVVNLKVFYDRLKLIVLYGADAAAH